MELLKSKSPQPHIDTGLVFVARVIAAEQGRAKTITMLHDQQEILVCGHGAMVSELVSDDTVTTVLTVDGAIIIDRVCTDNEKPKQAFSVSQDGSLSLDNANGIEIKTSHAQVKISENGSISINGKNVQTSATAKNIIRGGVIRIN